MTAIIQTAIKWQWVIYPLKT